MLFELRSIHELQPLEEGGTAARQGFVYQDHVAASFCIDMLLDEALIEVWCETEDDVTLIRNTAGLTLVEFVQVKATEPDQLWTVALICNGGVKSLIAKSLAHDRCAEACTFRIISRQAVKSELRPLLLALDHENRRLTKPQMLDLHKDACTRIGNLLSPRGKSVSNWLSDTLWEVRESQQALVDANLHKLRGFLETLDEYLLSEHLMELYRAVVSRTQQAALGKWADGADQKKLRRPALHEWLVKAVQQIKGQVPAMAGVNLRRKMTEANIPSEMIDNAKRLRWAYRTITLDSRYQQDDGLREAELELTAQLQKLLSELDTGAISDVGRNFHARCLHALELVRTFHPTASLSFLQGAMYAATDRCLHRFLRASL
jgi:hypothetical protein